MCKFDFISQQHMSVSIVVRILTTAIWNVNLTTVVSQETFLPHSKVEACLIDQAQDCH